MNLADTLCSKWHLFLATGIVLILLGTIALGTTVFTTYATVFLFGVLLAGGGIAQIIHAFFTPEWKGFFVQLLMGILGAVVGGLTIFYPTIGAVSLTLLLATLFIVSGIFKNVNCLV